MFLEAADSLLLSSCNGKTHFTSYYFVLFWHVLDHKLVYISDLNHLVALHTPIELNVHGSGLRKLHTEHYCSSFIESHHAVRLQQPVK